MNLSPEKSRLWGLFAPQIFLLLLLCGCQPYPDHGEPIYDYRADFVDFGVRRELAISRFRADNDSLLIEFNQPLQRLEQEGGKAPFELVFQPRVPVQKTVREGAAGVRVWFDTALPPARRYRATVPTGWKALTGATFLKTATITWLTARPALERLDCEAGLDNWEPGQILTLVFNQALELQSMEASLRIKTVPEGLEVELSRPLKLRPIPDQELSYELSLPDLDHDQRYKLFFDSGLKSEEGPVLGEEGDGFFFGPRPEFQLLSESPHRIHEDHFLLEFSEPVEAEELKRHLKGLDWDTAFLQTTDNLVFELHWRASRARGPAPRNLTLLGSIRSQEGKRLGHDRELLLEYPTKQVEKSEWRDLKIVAPGRTVLNRPVSKGTRLSTWSLQPSELAELSSCSSRQWESSNKLKKELSKPLYSKLHKKQTSRTRFLEQPKEDVKASKFGAFLIRETTEQGVVKRTLVQRTDLSIDTFSLNDLMSYRVTSAISQRPKSRVLVQVVDEKGSVLVAGQTDSSGQGSVSFPSLRTGHYVRCAQGADWCLTGFQHRSISSEKALPGQIWSDGAVYESGAELHYFGCWWVEELRPGVVLTDREGRVVEAEAGPAEQLGHLFKGKLTLPREPGEYYIELPTENFRTPSFRVTVLDYPVVDDHPSSLSLTFDDEQNRFKGSYSWNGPGAEGLDLRASLRPKKSHHRMWTSVEPEHPHWLSLEVEHARSFGGGTFEVEKLPTLSGAWELVVELHDVKVPERVFRREVAPLGRREVELAGLELKHIESDVRLARFSFRINGRENLPTIGEVNCRLDLRGEDGWELLNEASVPLDGAVAEWTTPIEGSGRARLSCRWSDRDGPHEASWETLLESDALANWEPLELSSETIVSNSPLLLSWPGLAAGRSIWVRAYAGNNLLHNSMRASGPGGDLGSLELRNLRPGSEEVTIVAALSDGEEVRGNRVEVMSVTHFLPATLEINDETLESFALDPGESITVDVGASVTPMEQVLMWWEQDLGRSEEFAQSAYEALVTSGEHLGTTLHGTRKLPVIGPKMLGQSREVRLKAPSESGSYNLLFLSEGEESTYYFARIPIEIQPAARWKALIPLVNRPGDRFSAGVRFSANPDATAPTGVTTSIDLNSTLLPLSYFSTAALVDPGARGDMLFLYRSPDFVAPTQTNSIFLRWELGVEGETRPVEATLDSLPSGVEETVFQERTLSSGEAVRVGLSGLNRWRVVFTSTPTSSHEKTTLLISGVEEQELRLEVGQMPIPLYGEGGEPLEVRHQSGPPVQLSVFRLKPKTPSDKELASSVYLMRRFVMADGTSVDEDEIVMSQEYLMSYHLVVAEDLQSATLASPFPGGVEPLGCWLKTSSGLEALGWQREGGEVKVSLPSLDPGEHQVLISCLALVDGKFSWPAGSVLDQASNSRATTTSGFVTILE